MDLLAVCKPNLLIAASSNIVCEGNSGWAMGFKHTKLYKILKYQTWKYQLRITLIKAYIGNQCLQVAILIVTIYCRS